MTVEFEEPEFEKKREFRKPESHSFFADILIRRGLVPNERMALFTIGAGATALFIFALFIITLFRPVPSSENHYLEASSRVGHSADFIPRKNSENGGFTLMDIIVVVALISFLASIAITSFSATRARAEEAVVLSDAVTMNLAVRAYQEDSGTLPPNPPSSNGKPTTSNDAGWPEIWSPLVSAGYLPNTPTPKNSDQPYAYYNSDDKLAVIIVHQKNPDQKNQKSCHPFGNGTTGWSTASCAPPQTLAGDTNSDGVIDFDDYVAIDNGYNGGLTGWANGDFDCNDSVDFDDYVIIDSAYNSQNQNQQNQIPTTCSVASEEFCMCTN